MNGLYTSFSQRDPRWADIPLGASRVKIADYGCLITAASSMLVDFGIDTDPGRLNRWLSRNNGYVDSNLFVFGSLNALVGASLVNVIDCATTPAPIDAIRSTLDQGGAVLALVDFVPGGSVNQHWVRVWAISDDDAFIMDPWLPPGFEDYWLMPRYALAGWSGPERAFFRFALYDRATILPAPSTKSSMRAYTTTDGEVFRQADEHQRRLCSLKRRWWWQNG